MTCNPPAGNIDSNEHSCYHLPIQECDIFFKGVHMPQTKTGYAPVENGELCYEVTGDGPALVLIHAGVADQTMWEPQLEPFSKSHKVITYDTRGFGRSRSQDATYSERQDIRDLLTHLGVEKATLIGNSRGGIFAIDTALEFPEMVSGVVWLCGGVSGFNQEPTKAEMEWFERMEALEKAQDWAALTDLEVLFWGNGVGQPEDRAPAHVQEKMRKMIYGSYTAGGGEGRPRRLDPPAAGRLHELNIPILVIIGDLDESGTQASADVLAAGAPNARKVVFHNVAHMASMEKPEEFNKLVLDFLAENNL
jgi:pimeloyl-ACP methyl ester carboxylesterase